MLFERKDGFYNKNGIVCGGSFRLYYGFFDLSLNENDNVKCKFNTSNVGLESDYIFNNQTNLV